LLSDKQLITKEGKKMSLFELYLLFILPEVGDLMVAISFFVLAAGVTIISIGLFTDEMGKESARKIAKLVVAPALLILILGAFIPSKDAMKYIIGGYAVTNLEGIEKLPKNLVNAANAFLESQPKGDEK